MSQTYPERITQARELAGYSKSELAEFLGVSPAAVAQWESGVKHPTAENVASMARCLGVPMPLLMRSKPAELLRCGPLTFRAWSSAKTRRLNRRAARLAELVAESYLWLEERVTFPPASLPETPAGLDVEEAAAGCRRRWGLGDRPLLKLGELLESKGIMLGAASFGDQRFDAFSCIMNGRPFVFLGNEKQDRARSRFDAAHELGHLVLHQHLAESDLREREVLERVEAEANSFGSAFLMPAQTFSKDILDTGLDGFLKLKAKWGVSVQAMVVRSHSLGIVSENQYRELFRQISMKGWRRTKGEPFDDLVPAVQSSVGKRGLELLESNGVMHAWEISAVLPMPEHVLCDVFQIDPGHLAPIELGKVVALKDHLESSAGEPPESGAASD
jgi:Zn-dependent peptidase ImmA (M78 family)/DNA-binding XRE family transcriptional regulator